MGELLLRKALQVRDRIARVRGALPARDEDVLADERLEAFISFQLFLAIQDVVALATHLVAAKQLGVPGSQHEAFELLAGNGLLTSDTARAMGAIASLRNRIAHAYGDVDPVRLVHEAPSGLEKIEAFLDELAAAIAGA
jgi:uncharacterized protein YutE (UPF0331/DUF86 family)